VTLNLQICRQQQVLRSRRVLSDSIAAIAAGAGEPEVQALTAKLLPGAPGAASLIGQSGQAATATAAFLNGTAGTFLELDEGNQYSRGHPGIHVLPVALAVAEECAQAGRTFPGKPL
jgi:2-methylcitrate dehydratase PrpD